jgi:hypothetical protein
MRGQCGDQGQRATEQQRPKHVPPHALILSHAAPGARRQAENDQAPEALAGQVGPHALPHRAACSSARVAGDGGAPALALQQDSQVCAPGLVSIGTPTLFEKLTQLL